MIDIVECELKGKVYEVPIFRVKGTYDNELFDCHMGVKFSAPEEYDQIDYEYLDGVDLNPDGLEELVDGILETEAYQEALEGGLGRVKDL